MKTLFPAALLLAVAATASAQEATMADRLRNDPRADALQPYGQPIPPVVRADKGVQFGRALRFRLPGGSGDPGRIGLVSPLLKPVRKGDRVVVAFWARAEETADGAPGRIGRVQLETTPAVRAIYQQPFEVTKEWKMYQLSGIADADYAPRQLNAAIHLNAARQVIDIGPVFVLDYGQPQP